MRPDKDTHPTIPLSVWLEGKCRKYHVESDGSQAELKLNRGWVMLGESCQCDLLGVSVLEALPQDPKRDTYNPLCIAEQNCKHLMESGVSKREVDGATVQSANKKARKT